MKDGTYPSKLIQSFTDKAVLKSRKKNFRELVKKDKRYKLIEVIEKGHNTLCLSKNWSYNLQSNTRTSRGNNEEEKNLIEE